MTKLLLVLLLAASVNISAEAQTPAPKHPFFQLDAQAKRALVKKASTLKPGDSYQERHGSAWRTHSRPKDDAEREQPRSWSQSFLLCGYLAVRLGE
jgi:hypothetical protein